MQALGPGSRILVTGGAGVIGSVLTRRLVAKGYVVRVLDDLSRSRRERLNGVQIELRVEDVRSERAVKEAMNGCQGVIHLAAPSPRPRTARDERVGHDINVTGTLQVCAAAHAAGVARLVYTSSAAVYGPKAPYLLHEDAVTCPLSAEGAQKLAAEGYVRLYATRGLSACILRLFSVYGPLQDGRAEDAPVLARFVAQAVRGEPLLIHGDGMQTRDFVHVDDVVDALVASLEVPNLTGRVFNVAAGTGVPIRHVIATLSELLGGLPPPRYVERSEDEPKDVRASVAAASATLGFRARTRLREALHAWIQQVGGQRPQPRDQFRQTAPWGVTALSSPPRRITSPQPSMTTSPQPSMTTRPVGPPPLPPSVRPRGSGTIETPQVAPPPAPALFADRPPSWQVPEADGAPELSALPITDEELR